MTDSSLDQRFQEATQRVKKLSKQPNNVLLDLYALFKQASEGDVSGKRPGMLDVRGRAKFDAWSEKKGQNPEEAKQAYIDLVDKLEKAEA